MLTTGIWVLWLSMTATHGHEVLIFISGPIVMASSRTCRVGSLKISCDRNRHKQVSRSECQDFRPTGLFPAFPARVHDNPISDPTQPRRWTQSGRLWCATVLLRAIDFIASKYLSISPTMTWVLKYLYFL